MSASSSTRNSIPRQRRSTDFAQMLLDIRSAAFDAARWPELITGIANSVRAESAVLFTPTAEVNRGLTCAHEIDPGRFCLYPQYAPFDLWMSAAHEQRLNRTGAVVDYGEHVDAQEFAGSLFYNEWLKPQNVKFNLCAVLWGEERPQDAPLTVLNLFRGEGRTPFGRAERDVLRRLAPHLSAAFQGYAQLRALRLQEALLRRALADVAAALWVVDATQRVLFANPAAEELMREGAWLRCSHHHLQIGRDVLQAERVADLLKAAASATQALELRDGRRGILNYRVLPEEYAPPQAAAGGCALLWLVPLSRPRRAIEVATRLFKLTPAEARLVALLMEGNDLPRAAQRLQRSHHTVRMQLRTVFAKTGQRSQSGLCLLMDRVAAAMVGSEDARPTHGG
jgi:DNA-binding CsgD family transcriptional regulator